MPAIILELNDFFFKLNLEQDLDMPGLPMKTGATRADIQKPATLLRHPSNAL